MVMTNNSNTLKTCIRNYLSLVSAIGLLLLAGSFASVSFAVTSDGDIEHFKMLSTVEYTGKGQFKNQVETMFTVRQESSMNDKFRKYFVTTKDFDLVSGTETPFRGLSFMVDRSTMQMSTADKELALLEKVNNQCVISLEKLTKDNVGKTWKQSFSFSLFDESLPDQLKFTLSAIQVETKAFGEMIAVRALSEPFAVKAFRKERGKGSIKSTIKVVYLFDSEIEDIYLSMSVLEATTKISGTKETLRHEVATYKTNAAGTPVDLSGLGKKFESFVRKVGLSSSSLKVVDESPLPLWAQFMALGTAQVANISAAVACEGAT